MGEICQMIKKIVIENYMYICKEPNKLFYVVLHSFSDFTAPVVSYLETTKPSGLILCDLKFLLRIKAKISV